MFLLLKRKSLFGLGLMIAFIIFGLAALIQTGISHSWVVNSNKYRIFVAGVGTVEGVWADNLGIAVIGLATKSSTEDGRDLKVIDILVANAGHETVTFNPDFTLTDKNGDQSLLTSDGQPEVLIKPGALSQGRVIIDVPRGVKNEDLTLEIKGGCLPEGVVMPLKVQYYHESENES